MTVASTPSGPPPALRHRYPAAPHPHRDGYMTYTGGFGTDGVTTKGGDVTLTLTEGKNIVKISKDGADTYQVITVKKAGVVITNKTDPTRDILPGDTVTVQLTGVYHPANTMANLGYSLFAYASPYTDPARRASRYRHRR
ncbi:MAG: hypothetical protein ACLU38_05810 [Dysosmobacter sp.]